MLITPTDQSRSILVIDRYARPCGSRICDQLSQGTTFKASQITYHVQVYSNVPTDFQPALVLVRLPSNDSGIVSLISQLKETWSDIPIIGIRCGENTCQGNRLNGLAETIDCRELEGKNFLQDIQLVAEQTSLQTDINSSAAFNVGQTKLIGNSQKFVSAINLIPLLAESDATIIICGETGTGKELVAREIHNRSLRARNPFLAVNCGALPENVFESEFFGHLKGAFTDASVTAPGIVGDSQCGTIFLDEVDSLSLSTQVKLLRFLQNGEYRPVGASKSLIADVRIIAATNTDLKEEVFAKRFRPDLYYRLKPLSIQLPPLRERRQDIPLLCRYFLQNFGTRYKKSGLTLSAGCLKKLMDYSWPGNIRELEGVLQRATVLANKSVLLPENIELPESLETESAGNETFEAAKTMTLNHFERNYLTDVLSEAHGNVSAAAKRAGKDRRSFQRLLRKHGLDRVLFRPIESV